MEEELHSNIELTIQKLEQQFQRMLLSGDAMKGACRIKFAAMPQDRVFGEKDEEKEKEKDI